MGQFTFLKIDKRIYSVFQSAEVQKLWVLGKRQEAKGKGEEEQVYLTSLGNAICPTTYSLTDGHIFQYKDKYCYVKASNS